MNFVFIEENEVCYFASAWICNVNGSVWTFLSHRDNHESMSQWYFQVAAYQVVTQFILFAWSFVSKTKA